MAEIISNINPGRIQWCCQQLSIDIADLAAHINAKQPELAEQKLRKGTLTYRQLKKTAEYLGYSPLFFLDPTPADAKKVHSVEFRTLANQSKQLNRSLVQIIKRSEWHRDIYVGLSEELDEKNFYTPPEITGKTIRQKANEVRQWLGLQKNATYQFDKYRKLVEAQGILVFKSSGYLGSWRLESNAIGFAIPHEQAPLIFIRKTSPQMQTFTLFHELGHLLLHGDSFIDDEDSLDSRQSKRKEQEANQFAADCLLPDDIDLPSPEEVGNYDDQYKEIAQKLGISVEVIVVKLLKEGKISQQDYKSYKEIKKLEQTKAKPKENTGKFFRSRYKEPEHIFGAGYVSTVLDAMHADIVTLNKASNYLDRLKIDDIRKLECSP